MAKQWYAYIEGQQYGPVDEEQLRQWIREDRVHQNDAVWTEGMSDWAPASEAIQPTEPAGSQAAWTRGPAEYSGPAQTAYGPGRQGPTGVGAERHRGGVILALGAASWLTQCFILGIVAWVMGNNDLRAMDEGRMDSSGRDLTQAGRILGMIHAIVGIAGAGLAIIWFLFWLLFAMPGIAAV